MCSHDAKTNTFSAGGGLRMCVWPTDPYTFTKPGPYNQTFKNKGDANFRY